MTALGRHLPEQPDKGLASSLVRHQDAANHVGTFVRRIAHAFASSFSLRKTRDLRVSLKGRRGNEKN
jgi:hypothetical protein